MAIRKIPMGVPMVTAIYRKGDVITLTTLTTDVGGVYKICKMEFQGVKTSASRPTDV